MTSANDWSFDCGPGLRVPHVHYPTQFQGSRITLCVAPEEVDRLQIRRGVGASHGFLTDLGTLETFELLAAHCGTADCYCDQEAVLVDTDGAPGQ